MLLCMIGMDVVEMGFGKERELLGFLVYLEIIGSSREELVTDM